MNSDQLVPQRQQQTALATATATATPERSVLDVIARAAADPTIDVAKMQALLAMQMEIMAEQRKSAFFAAMADIQPLLPRIARGGVNTHTKKAYSRYEDIDSGIRDILNRHGFAVSFTTEDLDAAIRVTCIVSHVAGYAVANSLKVPTDRASAAMNAIQAVRSAVSYAKRTLVEMAFNLVAEGDDDDGRAAGGGGYITDDQAMELETLLHDCGADFQKFLAVYKVPRIGNLTEAQYRDAKIKIAERKRRS